MTPADAAAAFCCRYFTHGPPSRQGLMVDNRTPFRNTKYNFTTLQDANYNLSVGLDTHIPRLVHFDVITLHSNFFRRALSGGLQESRLKAVKLHDVDEQILEFFITYIYEGWTAAIENTFSVYSEENVTPSIIAKIMIFADYLDAPGLCYEAYSNILSRIARLTMKARNDIQFVHNLCVRQKPFIAACQVLQQSRTKVGLDLATQINRLMNGLQHAHKLEEAIQVFRKNFENDWWILDRELQWYF
ncbi:hypothetical protein F4804DRAFT_347054 [Jackrogersella minutella]|nr:hypothetical protein F4804DRAFT_347054 [Jackrogersella minutella]